MEKSYIFEYLDENDFRKRERSVRKYNMLAYKKLTFENAFRMFFRRKGGGR